MQRRRFLGIAAACMIVPALDWTARTMPARRMPAQSVPTIINVNKSWTGTRSGPPGSLGNPFRSMREAFEVVRPHDTIRELVG